MRIAKEIHVTMTKPPRVIYFDLGKVLLDFDVSIACRQMSEVAGVSQEQVHEILYKQKLQYGYESGQLSTRQFYDRFCEQSGTRPDYDALIHAGSAMFELRVPMVPLVALLRAARHRLGILSNTCEAHWDYVSDGRFRIIPELFELNVLSFRIGAMKPAAEIYLAAADLAQVSPDEVFFLDDREENVIGARDAGLDAVHFSTPQALARELRQRGVEFNY
jgi:putative hydrolase of the HAD superfamily